ncbi:phosphoribosyltransferase family protein [Paenirhodobacter sp. CAU 1674]|uniref:phosphoribosyltransferase n=1 Tax=Paenirhodobacter sp. CAU 1674 TaxID=3032596 RepID=UPI0023D9B970|nr:phosphoribosyltransferase family protein [Paenirhodobacter sp. CAU 1674]MDF2141766.1 phosphoribosyltransferase family protein [Paenirhodobacter sp. CAU 1674]
MTRFADRTEAGKALAAELAAKGYKDPVVLALPRGGVPVAIEVARALHAPMDLVMVRKIGLPHQPELAAAAIVNGDHPQLAINEAVVAHAGLSREDLDRLAQVQLAEIRRRRAFYLKDRASVPVEGRTVIVVDDGIATGATMRASLQAVRLRKPARLVLAVPVAAPDTLEELRAGVDEVVCLLRPRALIAVGAHYVDFGQTSDEEVVRLMDEAERLLL